MPSKPKKFGQFTRTATGLRANSARMALAAGILAASPLLSAEFRFNTPNVDEGLRQSIRDVLATETAIEDPESTATDILAAAQADYRRILAALYDNGHFAPVVNITLDGREASGIPTFDAPTRIRNVEIKVVPGPKFSYGRATVAPLPGGATPPETFRTGETATLSGINGAASKGVNDWRATGHAKADVAGQQITARHPQRELDVDIALAPGPKVRFGRLRFEGLDRLREQRAQEIAGLPTGEVFTPRQLDRVTNRLRATGVFRTVALSEAETVNPDGTLDIEAQVVETKLRRIGFGAEIATLDGGTLSAFWLHRNLLGGAERFRVDGRISGITPDLDGVDWRLGVTLTRPGTIDADTSLTLSAAIEHVNDPAYETDSIETLALLTRQVNDDIEATAGIGLARERTTDAFGTRTYTLVTLPLSGAIDKRDNALNPTKGTYASLTATPFVLPGETAGLRMTGDFRGYRSFGAEDRVTFAGRLQMGSVMGAEIGEAPADFLFYSGGGGTVRGHGYQSLGVGTGDTMTGGRSFVGLSAEARVRVSDNIQVVGFADYGLIGPDSMPTGDDPSHSGAGIGLRYNTGIGPVRLDLATPTSGDDAYGRVEIYVGLGQSF
ncbi:autotransporter assembly complex protein TamA [Mesobacterium pallidum]|uniref:autotransporter assembly complex protein TamA n=1 Tax=Mesobacterium pallidum TaxID=2872037 RepID=UPI001EE17F58|nr:BamA/TamA family outer membrane protein [Mesobacterium pallidum]